MGLFKPAWMTSDSKKAGKAVDAVSKIVDQAKLARIAREAPLGQVRTAAASRMTDQEALFEVAASNWSSTARKAAIGNMDDAHLVRFAGKVPSQECIKACHPSSPEPDEVLAVGRIRSSEALADLYLLLQKNRVPRTRAKDYPYWSGYKGQCEAALRERMDEAACAIAARKLLADGGKVDPADFLGSRIQAPELRCELGIDVDKAELMKQFRDNPSADMARLLWPLLDDDEKGEMQRAIVDYVSGRLDNRIGNDSFESLISLVDDRGLYAKLLMVNPNGEHYLMWLIERIDDPESLRRFLDMLDGRDVYTYPGISRVPDPSSDNFIIHTNYGNDNWAQVRIRDAAERRIRYLEKGY